MTVEARAFVAAGTTVTDAVPGGALGLGRARQKNVLGWRDRKFGPGDSHG